MNPEDYICSSASRGSVASARLHALRLDIDLLCVRVSQQRFELSIDSLRLAIDSLCVRVSKQRYEQLWLPLVVSLVASHTDDTPLVPPLDIAWVWHLHRLAPLKYAAYCRQRFGTILDAPASAFRLQSLDNLKDEDDSDCIATRAAWARAYPTEPFFLPASGLPSSAPPEQPCLFEQIVATSVRQRTFLWQVSGASFSSECFLAAAIDRYDKFLRLMGTFGYHNHFYVPTYDIDLAWHTHSKFSCIIDRS